MSSGITPPPTRTLAMMLAFVDGKPYVAPAGSTFEDDAWIRVESIEGIAEKFGIELDDK